MDIARDICTDSFYIVNSGLPCIAVTAVWQILPFTSKEFFMKISAVDLLANLMKEKTTSLILIVPYVCVQEAESHAYSYCNLKENLSAKIFIFCVPSPSTARGLP